MLIDIHAAEAKILGVSRVFRERSITQSLGSFPVAGRLTVENGVNARQALSPILAASAGVVTGAGTGTIVIRGANGTISRITATTDNAGNRSSVTLSLPT
jgi:N-acetylglucosamine kinase-like BadF-type ATPase